MKRWSGRLLGTLGTGLLWATAWGLVGSIVTLGFVLRTGSRPDAPFPLMAAAFGCVAGMAFSATIRLVGGRSGRMSLRRSAACGAITGMLLSATGVLAVSLGGDPAFLPNGAVIVLLLAIAAAGSAAGSSALVRWAEDRALLDARARRVRHSR